MKSISDINKLIEDVDEEKEVEEVLAGMLAATPLVYGMKQGMEANKLKKMKFHSYILMRVPRRG